MGLVGVRTGRDLGGVMAWILLFVAGLFEIA
jgi:hypothetical protein